MTVFLVIHLDKDIFQLCQGCTQPAELAKVLTTGVREARV
jgi:hypothetical protein